MVNKSLGGWEEVSWVVHWLDLLESIKEGVGFGQMEGHGEGNRDRIKGTKPRKKVVYSENHEEKGWA